jgi:hypothetical protein
MHDQVSKGTRCRLKQFLFGLREPFFGGFFRVPTIHCVYCVFFEVLYHFTIALCHINVKSATVCTQPLKKLAVSLFPETVSKKVGTSR